MRKPRTVNVVCENCSLEFSRITVQKNPPRFCSKSCSNSWQHANGIRRAYCSEKTVEQWWSEKYPQEKVKELKKKLSEKLSLDRRRPIEERLSPEALKKVREFAKLSWDVKFGEEKSREMKKMRSQSCGWEGKSLEERFTKEKSIEIRQKAGASNRGKKRSEETRKKMSISAHERMLENPNTILSWGIKGWYKGHFFRSSYEYFFMKMLEKQGLSLKDDVQQETFRIPYHWEGNEKIYVPDFYVPSQKTVYEVKNSYSIETDPQLTSKFEAARSYFSEKDIVFLVVTELTLELPEERKIRSILQEDACVFLLPDREKSSLDLKVMFEEQIRFMKLLKKERGFTEFPVNLETKEGQKVVKNISHECMHELFEAVHLLSDAKDHKKSLTSDFDKQKFIEELSDVLHYFLGICILCDISAEDLYNEFMRKGTVNFSRILGGY